MEPLIVAYGVGSNSTALLIGYVDKGIKPDHIIFADTGGERPETYEYLKLFDKWLIEHDMPSIEIAKTHLPPLYENCILKKELPSVVYGRKSCSDKWKTQPINRLLRAKGYDSVIKAIGIDADEAHRAGLSQLKWIKHIYPLIEWNWGRDECIEAISKAGLPQPGKSSCYFCPNMRQWEIKKLSFDHPNLAQKAIAMEKNANLTAMKGLGRSYSWGSYLATPDMFDENTERDMPCGCYDG